MVLKRWADIWNLYKKSGTPSLRAIFSFKKIPRYWLVWVSLIAYCISAWVFTYKNGYVALLGLVAIALSFWLLFKAMEKALSQEYRAEYEYHSLSSYSHGDRRLYLRYSLFLRSIAQSNLEKSDIESLFQFAKVAGGPAPVFSLSQHPTAVPLLAIITALSTDMIKETQVWKAGNGIALLLILGFGLLFVLAILDIIRGSKQKHVEIARFLEWAAKDYDSAKSNYAFNTDAPKRRAG